MSWLNENKILETLFERNRVEEELIKKGMNLLVYVANMRLKQVPGALPNEILWTMWRTASELGTKSKYVIVLRALAKVLNILGNRVMNEMLSRDEFQDSIKTKSCRERTQKLLLLLHGSNNAKSTSDISSSSSQDTTTENVEVSVNLVWRIIWSENSPSLAMLRLLGDLTRGKEDMVTTYVESSSKSSSAIYVALIRSLTCSINQSLNTRPQIRCVLC